MSVGSDDDVIRLDDLVSLLAEDVIDHYAAGGRTIADGPYRGVGHDNPNKSVSIRDSR
jgi:cytochrome c peroxidase